MPKRRKKTASKARKAKSTSAKAAKRRVSKSSATKGLKKRVSRAAAPVKRTAMKVLAGAAAGAMRALAPEVQKVANSMGGQSKQGRSTEDEQ